MSGFAGIIRLDDRRVEQDTLARLRDAVAHRGPDAQGEWSDERAAFAHAMLRTTPESVRESQPYVDRDLVIVADARLDRDDSRDDALTDIELIAAAYRKWGSDCVRHLEGDFAFAIWNRNDRTLFCARDAFGVKPFVYAHVPGKLFAFGSEVRAVLAHEEVSRELDESRIADFLGITFGDNERTFYASIKRLPPATTLVVRDQPTQPSKYWSIANVSPLRLAGGDAAYAEGFREHFLRAVRTRMRVRQPSELGALLSGGLDSSSITCIARNEVAAAGGPPLPVFSWVFSDAREADEREYQQAVIAGGGVQPHTIDYVQTDASLWTDADPLLPDGPVYAVNYYLNTFTAKAAHKAGVRALLDGLGGDSTVSRGIGRLPELLLRGRFMTLARELRESPNAMLLQNVLYPITPMVLRRAYRALRPSRDPGLRLLRPEIAKLATDTPPRTFFDAREEHRQQFESSLVPEGLELFDRLNAHHGVEARYPFFDRRLAEYCLSLPSDQKLSNGYSRMVMRRALHELPDAVRWRKGKGAPGLHAIPAMRADRASLDRLFVGNDVRIARYVDMPVLRRTYEALLADRPISIKTLLRLWSAAILARWLELAQT